MQIEEAYKYTRGFKSQYIFYYPEVKSGFYFRKRNGYFMLKNINNSIGYTFKLNISEKTFKEKYSNLNINNVSRSEFILLNEGIVNGEELGYLFEESEYIYYIEEDMAFTSQGLINEEVFYLAQNIMKNTEFFKKKDLVIDGVYKSVNGFEYLYIGDTIFKNGCDEGTKYPDQIYSLNKERCINRDSVKLVEFIRNQKVKIEGVYAPSLSESSYLKN